MSNSFYKALLIVILIPYGYISLMIVWNIIGPPRRTFRKPKAE